MDLQDGNCRFHKERGRQRRPEWTREKVTKWDADQETVLPRNKKRETCSGGAANSGSEDIRRCLIPGIVHKKRLTD